MLIPLILPASTPLWMVAIATAFSVVFCKEVFGGTGMNILNPALTARVFLFFSYPKQMSGDTVWVDSSLPEGYVTGVDGVTVLNELGEAVGSIDANAGATQLSKWNSTIAAVNDAATKAAGKIKVDEIMDGTYSLWEQISGTIPGSIGETSAIAILIGAGLLLHTGVASWKIMASGVFGVVFMTLIFNTAAANPYMTEVGPLDHLTAGGFLFGIVFMATDPVSAAQTTKGKWIYGFLVGVFCILIRVFNPAYPEGVMLAILLMNVFAPLIDHYVIESNMSMRRKRWQSIKIEAS